MCTRSCVRLAYAVLSIVALSVPGRSASAQTFYTTGTYTVDAAHSVTGVAFAGYDGTGFNDSNGKPYNPTVNIVSGGSISSYLQALNSSTVNISGGTFGKFSNSINFFDQTTGAFTLIGSNLMATSLGADTSGLGGTSYALSGMLQGGTNLSGYQINVASGARMFTLQNTPAAVPEPGSVALLIGLGVTGAGLLARRRARK